MKKVNFNFSTTQPNFSRVINPCYVNPAQTNYVPNGLSKSNSCPSHSKIENVPTYPTIEQTEYVPTGSVDIPGASNDVSTCDDNDGKPVLSVTKEELLNVCQEELKHCAQTLNRIRESDNTDTKEIDFKFKLVQVIHEQLDVINLVL